MWHERTTSTHCNDDKMQCNANRAPGAPGCAPACLLPPLHQLVRQQSPTGHPQGCSSLPCSAMAATRSCPSNAHMWRWPNWPRQSAWEHASLQYHTTRHRPHLLPPWPCPASGPPSPARLAHLQVRQQGVRPVSVGKGRSMCWHSNDDRSPVPKARHLHAPARAPGPTHIGSHC